jgi:hypothetical protein
VRKLYLCGPINGCSDAEATSWREKTKDVLAGLFQFVDPMRRDYRGRELEPGIAHEIVVGDKRDYRRCHIVLAFCPKPSVGSSMEIFDAFTGRFCWFKPWTWLRCRTRVVVIHPEDKPSPWLIEHSDRIFIDFNDALAYLQKYTTEPKP